ncbi:MAG: hypothetical protein CVV27_06845 [Candidatus Melainabacteria bacterium HGW-Melainabacteria-1]|nr:MAG: hypothetical protein CVV27_06845 [Candidatus Melainabacteria bacterium HGW-Melainabacteria-1]
MIDVDDDNLWRVNLFDVLGVSDNASKDDLRNMYKQLAKKYHPDRFPAGSPAQHEAKEKFSDINRAYEVLSNDSKRQIYLDTRRLLAEHLEANGLSAPPPAAKAEAPAAAAASAEPAKAKSETPAAAAPAEAKVPSSSKKDGLDYKLMEAEDAYKEGTVQFSKSDLDGAISSFQRAISILPDTAKYHSNLGRAFLMKGWKGMAQSAFKQALVLNPNDPIAKKHYEPEKTRKKGLLDGLLGRFKKD